MYEFYRDAGIRLIAGVVEQAVVDLRRAINRGNDDTANYLKRWFRSEEGQALCMGHGEDIINRVERECAESKQKS